MSVAAKLVTFSLLVLAVSAVKGQSSPTAIRGTLSEGGTPIAGATIFLQSFDDETCAKLFTAAKEDPKSASKLQSCMHDVSSTSSDAERKYEFANPGMQFIFSGISPKSQARRCSAKGYGLSCMPATKTPQANTIRWRKTFHFFSLLKKMRQ